MSHLTVLQSAILASKVNAPSVYNINNIREFYATCKHELRKNRATKLYQ